MDFIQEKSHFGEKKIVQKRNKTPHKIFSGFYKEFY